MFEDSISKSLYTQFRYIWLTPVIGVGLIRWMESTLVSLGTVAKNDLSLFKLVDDIYSIPEEIRRYHDNSEEVSGFKIPTDEDRRRSEGK